MKKKWIIIGVGILILVLIVILLISQRLFQTNSTSVTVTPTIKVSLDGVYKGTTGVAGGLADATLTVAGRVLSGNATYNGVVEGRTITLPTTITGIVTDTGVITGTVAVSGTQYGQKISLTGPINGKITDSIMDCTYSVTGDVGAYGGQISLTKD